MKNLVAKRLEMLGLEFTDSEVDFYIKLVTERYKMVANRSDIPINTEFLFSELVTYQIVIQSHKMGGLNDTDISEIIGLISSMSIGDTTVSMRSKSSSKEYGLNADNPIDYIQGLYNDIWNELIATTRKFRW